MEVLIVGNGGREQAIAQKLSSSPEADNIYVAQGNAGTEFIDNAENVDIPPNDIDSLAKFATQKSIELTVVGPDDPLADGIVDEFTERRLKIFGPNKAQARIESDREFAKQMAQKMSIPIGKYTHCETVLDTKEAAKQYDWPMYIKKNGLAQGKGATRCNNQEEFDDAVEGLQSESYFDDDSVIVEDFIEGREASHHAFCDGVNHLSIPFLVRDHKTLNENDDSPMTGGMGVVGPLEGYSFADVKEIGDKFVAPVVEELGFRGMLFTGLKGGKGAERNLEWNARFGDPETQVFLRLLKSDLLPLLMACVEGGLANLDEPQWCKDRAIVSLVLATEGYPSNSIYGAKIDGIDDALRQEGIDIIHAGTKKVDNNFVISGGRVLNIIATGENIDDAAKKSYLAAEKISSDVGLQFRRDIGR